MKTWMVERTVAAVLLATVWWWAGGGLVETVGSLAVLAGFSHGQVADRLSEKEGQRASRPNPADLVECWHLERRYFLQKEALWLVYFVALGAWSALAGVGLFLGYRAWRALYRTYIKPIGSPACPPSP